MEQYSMMIFCRPAARQHPLKQLEKSQLTSVLIVVLIALITWPSLILGGGERAYPLTNFHKAAGSSSYSKYRSAPAAADAGTNNYRSSQKNTSNAEAAAYTISAADAGSGYTSGAGSRSSSSFVRAKGSQFVQEDDGRVVYVNGFNAYYLSYLAAAGGRAAVSRVLEEAASAGLSVGRTWAFNDGPTYHALQTSPGLYDEASFQAMDFVVDEARKNRVRLILSLVDNYPNMGGKQQYVQWARDMGVSLFSEDAFFTDPTVKSFYKNHVKAVLSRVNTLSGVRYMDDPTIFAWELMNEPRCPSDPSGDTLYAWIEEMASYVKAIDPNHMVEAGLEGFYGPSTPAKQAAINPWGAQLVTGTDYVRFAQIPAIDFTTVHSYPDIWLTGWSFQQQMEFMEEWVSAHVGDGVHGVVKKPVVFAEVGRKVTYNNNNNNNGPNGDSNNSDDINVGEGQEVYQRDALLSSVYSMVYASALGGGPAAGALVWQLCPAELRASVGTDGYAISLSPSSSTTALIAAQSHKLLSAPTN